MESVRIEHDKGEAFVAFLDAQAAAMLLQARANHPPTLSLRLRLRLSLTLTLTLILSLTTESDPNPSPDPNP